MFRIPYNLTKFYSMNILFWLFMPENALGIIDGLHGVLAIEVRSDHIRIILVQHAPPTMTLQSGLCFRSSRIVSSMLVTVVVIKGRLSHQAYLFLDGRLHGSS